jgi:TM2 domain-containing membrane protein YozV
MYPLIFAVGIGLVLDGLRVKTAAKDRREDAMEMAYSEAIDLYKFLRKQGLPGQAQMTSLVTWLTAFVFGLLGFCAQKLLDDKPASGPLVVLASGAAFALSLYMVYIITSSWTTQSIITKGRIR